MYAETKFKDWWESAELPKQSLVSTHEHETVQLLIDDGTHSDATENARTTEPRPAAKMASVIASTSDWALPLSFSLEQELKEVEEMLAGQFDEPPLSPPASPGSPSSINLLGRKASNFSISRNSSELTFSLALSLSEQNLSGLSASDHNLAALHESQHEHASLVGCKQIDQSRLPAGPKSSSEAHSR